VRLTLNGGNLRMYRNVSCLIFLLALLSFLPPTGFQSPRSSKSATTATVRLPTDNMLYLPVPGHAQRLNSLPMAVALSPDGRSLAILNNGYGTPESSLSESITILNLETGKLSDFPDPRFRLHARQTYFLGLAFGTHGKHLYASVASLSDPEGRRRGDTGNGIAIYKFQDGRITPERFLRIPLQPLPPRHYWGRSLWDNYFPAQVIPRRRAVPYPAGLAAIDSPDGEELLVANLLSDNVVLIRARTGEIVHRFDLSSASVIPASYPYTVVAEPRGKFAYVSLWNASEVAQLDLRTGRVIRHVPLLRPVSNVGGGSHPSAMLLEPRSQQLFVALSNADRVAMVDIAAGRVTGWLSTELPGQKYPGSFPDALAESTDGRRLFVADAALDAVGVFDLSKLPENGNVVHASGFIPTEWYPTALAVREHTLLVASGKGTGTGPNERPGSGQPYRFIASLIHGSIARVDLLQAELRLAALTRQVERGDGLLRAPGRISFPAGSNPIRHVIYIIKENRSYDQVFGDIGEANGDPSLCMFCLSVTPNEHALARQFGVLDNFYVSAEVSSNGHEWSTAAIATDDEEKRWEIDARGMEGPFSPWINLPSGEQIADLNQPSTGYLWMHALHHGISFRDYGEFLVPEWCSDVLRKGRRRRPLVRDRRICPRAAIRKGQPLLDDLGHPLGSPSPWPWRVPLLASNQPGKVLLEGHFDPHYPPFNPWYPDQFRADEFLREFHGFVQAREAGETRLELPQLSILWLPADHTMGTRPGGPTPAAAVADNDLALGRIVDAVSHSPYWADTAILVLEDDAQDGPDHVDAHRSTALVISEYSPKSPIHPFVDHRFYTTVSMIRTIEVLLGLPPMNAEDGWARPMSELFVGPGNQPPFSTDYRNQKSGLIYETNAPDAPGARLSMKMDFSRADRADAENLNSILWRDLKGSLSMPSPRHDGFLHRER
jgi:DNA-binding beta-propeller fold protein YncE